MLCSSGRIGQRRRQLWTLLAQLSVLSKFKSLLSFYQVLAVFWAVYGVTLPAKFTRWANVFSFLSVDLVGLVLPSSCVGAMQVHAMA